MVMCGVRGVARHGMVWYGVVWCGVVWCGVAWRVCVCVLIEELQFPLAEIISFYSQGWR